MNDNGMGSRQQAKPSATGEKYLRFGERRLDARAPGAPGCK